MAEPVRFRQYINALRANLEIGKSTEHTHRPAFKMLLESVRDSITATNEPGRIECGAPDFSIGRGVNRITVGYVEAKDLSISLDAVERDSMLVEPSTPNGRHLS